MGTSDCRAGSYTPGPSRLAQKIVVEDTLSGIGIHEIEINWHLHPDIETHKESGRILLKKKTGHTTYLSSNLVRVEQLQIENIWISPGIRFDHAKQGNKRPQKNVITLKDCDDFYRFITDKCISFSLPITFRRKPTLRHQELTIMPWNGYAWGIKSVS